MITLAGALLCGIPLLQGTRVDYDAVLRLQYDDHAIVLSVDTDGAAASYERFMFIVFDKPNDCTRKINP